MGLLVRWMTSISHTFSFLFLFSFFLFPFPFSLFPFPFSLFPFPFSLFPFPFSSVISSYHVPRTISLVWILKELKKSDISPQKKLNMVKAFVEDNASSYWYDINDYL
eukprot:TRINITY_DN2059_c0_g1_i4.p1 TRINITY_DN2059_c0_g1~~TRINITY_DN2059_c0_g1_i4.p1  ORF type:complete len:107 (+),score=11.27 TRINITY_DN2059_c0_g1_i4:590-910(+)